MVTTLRNLNVLLVEDNPGDARLVREMLREYDKVDMHLRCAETLAEAQAVLREGETELVLLDLSLPDSEGLDTFDSLADLTPGIPVVVFSGLSDEDTAIAAVQRGAQDYLVKGEVDASLLLRAMRYAVERQRAEHLSPSEAGSRKATVPRTRVLLVDPQPALAEGVASAIGHHDDMLVCGVSARLSEARKLAVELAPDVLVIDISIENTRGLTFIREVVDQHRGAQVLAFSSLEESLYAERALRAGARGYLEKTEPTEVLLSAIRRVAEGKVYLSETYHSLRENSGVATRDAAAYSPLDGLTDRELQVFELIGQGFKTGEIGEKLFLSVKTIETYREHLKEKLGQGNASELTRYAIAYSRGGLSNAGWFQMKPWR